jgi:membrane fusion protein (multidrug efflux system)
MLDKRKKTWVARLAPAAILLAAVGLVALVAAMPDAPEEAKPVEPTPVNVTVEPVRVLPEVAETFDLPGSVEPNRIVKVSAEVAGRIEAYGVRPREVVWQGRVYPQGQPIDEGEPVVEGQVLVQLNRDILQAERDRARAQSEYDKSEYERLLKVQQRGATTPQEVYQAETKMQVSRALLNVTEEQLKRAAIHSPISGILNRMMHEVGEYVQVGDEIAEIVEVNPAKVAVDVPERDVPFLSLGQEVPIFTGADAQASTGRITYIGSLANPQTRSSRVEITIPNPDSRLRSGQIVRVRLARGMHTNVVMIPLKAVMPLEEGYEVYVVRDGVAQSRQVKLDFIRQDRVVVQGLDDGEQLIVQGHRLVGSGQKVRVIGEAGDVPAELAATPQG